MKKIKHIVRLGEQYYYRRRFPKALKSIIGRTEYKQSLNTDSYQDATDTYSPYLVEYQNIVNEAKRKQAALDALAPEEPAELNDRDVMAMAASWYKQAMRNHQDDVRPKELSSENIEDREAFIARSEAEIVYRKKKQLGDNQYGSITPIVNTLLTKANIKIDRKSPIYQLLCKTILIADIAIKEGSVERLKGNYEFLANNELLNSLGKHVADLKPQQEANASIATPEDEHTLSDLIEAYRGECEVAWSGSTLASYNTVFKLLKAALGDDMPLSAVTRPICRGVFDSLQRLPTNWPKREELSGLSLTALIEKGAKLELPTLHKKTIEKTYLGPIRTMFQWAENEDWISKNHFNGLKIRQSAQEKDADVQNKKRPFKLDALIALFDTEPWLPRNERFKKKPSLFWGPLMALYHGFRVGEVSGLLLCDIDREEGVLVFILRQHFDEEGADRTLKTDNAYRVVPVHPELIKMGFEAFVQEQRKAGHRQLFPEAYCDANGKWGRHLTQWFSKHVRDTEKEVSKCTFHSFRHTFTDALRGAELLGTPVGQAISGRSTDYRATNLNADTVADAYGTRYKSSTLVPHVAKIRYEGLDLSHLYVQPTGQPEAKPKAP